MTKRKHTKKKQKRKHSKQKTNYRVLNTLLVIIIALILAIGFIIYNADTKKLKAANDISKQTVKNVETTIKKELTKVEKKAEEELDKYFDKIEIKKDEFEEYTKHLYEEYIDKEIEEHREETTKSEQAKKEVETKTDKKEETKKIEKVVKVIDKPKPTLSNRPKLAIIIDDVTTQHQLNKIKKIGYTVTPALMPPTKGHPHSAKIAKDLPFYMIHFPLQASTFRGEESNTLHIDDSYEEIEQRVAQIRRWYPNAKYTNNHTGSKFTADEESMDKLFRALIKYDFVFMDSRTTAKTVAKKMARKYKMPYIVRNVFLDNEQDFGYIQNQLKKAIKIAKKNGYAIAICHPHSITIKVLKESKHLLEGLEMIYLNQIPQLNN
jgi:polysaccharide deacetylase 2 family uncharacterized protein YibQ